MPLYHGTTKRCAEAALADGIKPRAQGVGNWPDRPSRLDCVYLTAAFGATYAVSSSVKANEPETVECAIIEIEAPDDGNPLPDEDFLTECILMAYSEDEFEHPSNSRKRELSLSLRDTLEEYGGTDWLPLLDSRHRDKYKPIDPWIRQYCAVNGQGDKVRGWEASVFGLGSCAYKGTVIPRCIRRVAYIQRSHQVLQLLGKENIKPSIYAYQKNRGKLLSYNALIFGDLPLTSEQERFRAGIRVVQAGAS